MMLLLNRSAVEAAVEVTALGQQMSLAFSAYHGGDEVQRVKAPMGP